MLELEKGRNVTRTRIAGLTLAYVGSAVAAGYVLAQLLNP